MRELIHSGQFRGHKAIVVGAGRSGVAAARLLAALGASVRLLDRTPESVDEATRSDLEARSISVEFGEHTPAQFEGANLVVVSPGIPRRNILALAPSVPPTQIMSELELASWFVAERTIAITGTNGKTTTTALIAHVLEASGKTVFAGANFGAPLSEYILGSLDNRERAEVLVLEVSSFQLQGCSTFRPDVAVLLNFSANHLDYHETIEEYLEAKLGLFSRQRPGDLAILPLEMKDSLAGRSFTKARTVYFVPTERFPDSPLLGRHNQANLEAAYLAVRPFGVTEEQMAEALRTFKPLPHRIERVGELDGVLYVDDSKATTVDAMHAAIDAFDRPVLLLAGGVWKGGDLDSLVPLLGRKVRAVGLFGASREVFEAAWAGRVDLEWSPTLAEAVRKLQSKGRPGDVMLLSPATASFDLYSGYKARGDDFQRIFHELGHEPGHVTGNGTGNGSGNGSSDDFGSAMQPGDKLQ